MGVLNSFTNYGHHTFHLPQTPWIHWISFVISMLDTVILAKVLLDVLGLQADEAPGQLLERDVSARELGELLVEGESLLLVDEALLEELVDRVQIGLPIRLKVASRPSHTFVGTIGQISPAAMPDSSGDATVTVWGDLDNGEGLLRPGLEARAKVVGARKPIGYLVFRPLVRWIQMRFWR